MPIYEARCPACDSFSEYVRPVAQCMDTPMCGCGTRMAKVVFSVPMGYIKGRFDPFRSTVDGTIIANHRDMEEHNKRNGVVCMADGYSDETVRKGLCGRTAPSTSVTDKNELRNDLAEAALMVREGYKPRVEVHDE